MPLRRNCYDVELLVKKHFERPVCTFVPSLFNVFLNLARFTAARVHNAYPRPFGHAASHSVEKDKAALFVSVLTLVACINCGTHVP